MIIVFYLLVFFTFSDADTYKYTVCTTSKYLEACEQINRTNIIQCIVLGDEASCIERIDRGEATFASLSAEGAFLGVTKTNLLSLATFLRETESDPYDYQTAIVTNTKIENGLASIKGFSYCHPGFDVTNVTPLPLQEFENQLLSDNNIDICGNGIETLAEKHIKAINDFFGPSCRRGKWVQDDELDKKLKEKYPKLTELCNSTPYQSNNGTPFLQTLDCVLSASRPTVALTTIGTISKEKLNRQITAYTICKNGSISEINNKLCEWTTIPHKIVVVNKNNYGDLPAEFRSWFASSLEPTLLSNRVELNENQVNLLKQVLFPDPENSHNIIVENVSPPRSLYEHISSFRGNLTVQSSRLCNTELRWCTISDDEQRKCEVWSRASLNYGIQPVLRCTKKDNRRECIDSINAQTADAVTIRSDYGYFAKLAGLAAIAFPETIDSSLVRTLLIVNTNITRLENLRRRKGCFARYGDAAWLSFIDATRSIILDKDTCEYGKLLSDALGDSCMPGAGKLNLDNACSLCVSNTSTDKLCASDSSNKYYGNQGALNCLRDVGDFAVITKADELVIPENTFVMCKNGSLAKNSSLDVDDDCYLSVIIKSEIVTRRDDPKNRDIQLALLEYDRRFAVDFKSPFKLFGVFDGTPNLLFQDSTPGLDLPNSSHKAIRNYKNIISHIYECTAPDSDIQISSSIVLTLIPIILLLIF